MFRELYAPAIIALLVPPTLFAQPLGPVRNFASHDNRLSPGSLAQINGPFSPTSGPVTVQVGGREATVISRAFTEVVIQIPVELTPGPTTVVVTSNGVRLDPHSITLEAYAPGLYVSQEYSSVGVFYRSPSSIRWPSLVECAHPAFPTSPPQGSVNEVLTVFATGLGATSPPVPSGVAAPATPPASLVAIPTVTVAGRTAEVLRAVLAPGLVGVYQVDFRLPSGIGDSFHPVVLSIAGTSSNTVFLPVGSTFYNISAAKLGGWPENEEWVAAPESIVTARRCTDWAIANPPVQGDPHDPPATLAGVTIKVSDSAGVSRSAPLQYVSPFQVNYIIPAGTANGKATVTMTTAFGSTATATLDIQSVVPALFTRDGFTLVTQVVRVREGVQTVIPTGQPIEWGPESDELFLVLFGTGFRFRSSLANVRVSLFGVDLPVEYAGAQGEFAGLDQLNLRLPRSIRSVTPGYWLGLTVDGKQLQQDLGHGLAFR